MSNHPYQDYEGTLPWKIIDEAISALAANHDIREMTAREHLVGFLVKRLIEGGACDPT